MYLFIGLTGILKVEEVSNIIRKKIKALICIRLPPTLNCKDAEKFVINSLTKDPLNN